MKARTGRTGGIHRDNIDRQILALHKAMVKKVLSHPTLIKQVSDTLEQRYASGTMRHGAYINWASMLEMADKPADFADEVLEDSPSMRKLRRQTPFVGVLSEQERQDALDLH